MLACTTAEQMNFFTQTIFFAAPIYLCLRLCREAEIAQMFRRNE